MVNKFKLGISKIEKKKQFSQMGKFDSWLWKEKLQKIAQLQK